MALFRKVDCLSLPVRDHHELRVGVGHAQAGRGVHHLVLLDMSKGALRTDAQGNVT